VIETLKRPQVILRLVGLILALITFALAASTEGLVAGSGFLVFAGVSGFLFSLIFFIFYLIEHKIQDYMIKYAPLIEFIISILWIFFFFAASVNIVVKANLYLYHPAQAKAAAAFGFFSVFSWVGSAYFAFKANKIPLPFWRQPASVSV
jgi:hypothetical protein